MKKALLIIGMFALSLQFVQAQEDEGGTSASTSTATRSTSSKELSKDEKKRIKKELKNYKKQPENFKSMIESYKSTIDEQEDAIDKLKQDLADARAGQSALDGRIDEVNKRLSECLNRPLPKCPECPTATAAPYETPDTGTIYKVQLGLYEKFDITGYFATPKFIGSEKVENMNAYVVSYFESEDEAQKFKTDLRKLGVRDAFVSKYVDGKRVYEWDKNPKFKNKKAPATVQEGINAK